MSPHDNYCMTIIIEDELLSVNNKWNRVDIKKLTARSAYKGCGLCRVVPAAHKLAVVKEDVDGPGGDADHGQYRPNHRCVGKYVDHE